MAYNAYASSSKHTLDIPELQLPTNVAVPPPSPPPPAPPQVSTQARKETDFHRYLAGQSVMKSGLTRDQAEVNKIIADASKDSKFFKREREKDDLLVKRIEGLMRKKEELEKRANLPKLEKEANEIIAKLEATRDLSQKIVHVDLDAFYEARKYGVRSGMAGFIAKKLCPHLIFVKNNFADYSEASKQVREVLARYDENLAMAGLDEGYLNITPYMTLHDMSASDVVSHLRAAVEAETGLTISAGIAPNKLLAKICSDKNKPDGQFELEGDAKVVKAFMRDLPIRRVPGVGRVAERILSSMGVQTCGDVYTHRAVINLMDHHLGLQGLLKAYLGIGSSVVQPGRREERKSVGCERTFSDKSNETEILEMLEHIAQELESDLARTGFAGRCVCVKYKAHTYEVKTRQVSLNKFVNTAAEIYPHAKELLEKEFPLKIRLLGIRMTHLKDLQGPQGGLDKFLAESVPGRKKRLRSASQDPGDDIRVISSDEDDETHRRPSESASPQRKAMRMHRSPSLADAMNCPICGKTLKNGTTNVDLNRHIDSCLRATSPEVISDDEIEIVKVSRSAAQPSPVQKRSKQKVKAKPPDKLQNAFQLMMSGK
ncbi:hypothetical protein QFC22_005305 [Naganishia vaughanmartiniae]|uniref:Uncharacterized protein n=1 Tax=Naganishia vaughanmartiniae TaxID=1424756 RepID=A0ACC2WWS6_9TREE|nr:hypothetical protein QFC22_005305 [Naganishia vaughanmartiniae]